MKTCLMLNKAQYRGHLLGKVVWLYTFLISALEGGQ